MKLSIGLDLFEDGYKLNFLGFHWLIPIGAREPRDVMETWGISYSEKALFLRWGTKYKIIWMPWDWGSCVRHEVVNSNGNLEKDMGWEYVQSQPRKPKDNRKMYQSDYVYNRKSGETQKRIATYYVDEMEWRWRAFHWLYKKGIKIGPKIVKRCISVEFNDEVGERTGSWKGGTISCGYELLPNEAPQECLRRMERERKF